MITVFPATATTFATNGLAILAPISSTIKQQINGEYALTAVFSSKDAEHLEVERILYANDVGGKQPFRITEIESNLDNTVEVYAPHVTMDLNDYLVTEADIAVKDGGDAITALLAATTETCPFTGSSDIATVSSALYLYSTVQAALFNTGTDDCWLNKWGGEASRDGFAIAMNSRIGADNGVQIRYRKNLTGLKATTDLSSVKTRVYPTCLDEDDGLVEGDPVDSTHISDYSRIKVGHKHFSDVKVGREYDGLVLYPTAADAITEIEARVADLYAAGLDLPTVSLDVQFLDLSTTEEYAEYAALESVALGDTVTVIHEPLGINVSLRVSRYEWDTEAKRYTKLTVGKVLPNIGQSVIDADINISAINESLTTAVKQGDKYNAVYLTHDDGFVAEAEINGQDVKVAMNATDGLAVYVDNVKVGGMYIINGEVRMVARTLADPEGGDRVYLSLEQDPNNGNLEAVRLYVTWDGTTWYEDLRLALKSQSTTEITKYNTSTSAGNLRLRAVNATEFSSCLLMNGSAQIDAGTDSDNLYRVEINRSTGVKILKRVSGTATTLETWT